VESQSGEDKVIRYFGFSDNHVFMDQKVLPKDQGVSYQLFREEGTLEATSNEEDEQA